MKRALFAFLLAVVSLFGTVVAQDVLSPSGVMTRSYYAQGEAAEQGLMPAPQSFNLFVPPADEPHTGLQIIPTYDGTITSNTNSAAIEAAIAQALAILQAQFSDPVTVNIFFRYSPNSVNGQPLGNGNLAQSVFPIYPILWTQYKQSLMADAKTSNDATSINSLPLAPLTPSVIVSSANGRAMGLSTAGSMTSTGGLSGGTFDGIVTLNSTQSYSFSRPAGNRYDAVRAVQHEVDEVLGLGSFVNSGLTDIEPQDLYSWSSRGTRNNTAAGTRYFSIDAGATNMVGYNQNPGGDYGDWLSGSCPQTTPYVQNAFSCAGQSSDVTSSSPEGVNLDVIGFDPGSAPSGRTGFDYDGDGRSDI